MKTTMDMLIGTLFLSRDIAHKAHLASESYSEHMALDGFYKGIVDLADTLAETYQGRFGRLLDIPRTAHDAEVPILESLESQREWVREVRYEAVPKEETHLQNIIDEIESLFCTTIYKLKFLK